MESLEMILDYLPLGGRLAELFLERYQSFQLLANLQRVVLQHEIHDGGTTVSRREIRDQAEGAGGILIGHLACEFAQDSHHLGDALSLEFLNFPENDFGILWSRCADAFAEDIVPSRNHQLTKGGESGAGIGTHPFDEIGHHFLHPLIHVSLGFQRHPQLLMPGFRPVSLPLGFGGWGICSL